MADPRDGLRSRLEQAGWTCRDGQWWESGPGPDLVRAEVLPRETLIGFFRGHGRSWRAELRDMPEDFTFAFLQWAKENGGDGGGGRTVIEGDGGSA